MVLKNGLKQHGDVNYRFVVILSLVLSTVLTRITLLKDWIWVSLRSISSSSSSDLLFGFRYSLLYELFLCSQNQALLWTKGELLLDFDFLCVFILESLLCYQAFSKTELKTLAGLFSHKSILLSHKFVNYIAKEHVTVFVLLCFLRWLHIWL